MSARTGGLILLQLLFDLTRVGGRADRVLDAPTQEAWIDAVGGAPASAAASTLHAGAPVAGLEFDGRRITGVRVSRGAGAPAERVTADHYVAALPVEQLRLLLTPELRRAEPRARAPRPAGHALDERDHVLPRPRRPARARPRDLHRLGVGADLDLPGAVLGRADLAATTATAASRASSRVDVSEWERPGPAHRQGRRRSARRRRSAPRSGASSPTTSTTAPRPCSTRRTCSRWFLDPAIEFPNPTEATNLEPLLINTAGSWADRPEAATRDPEPLPRLRLRAHAHRPRDDGGRQRGGAPRGQRDPRRERLRRAPLPASGSSRSPRSSRPRGRSTSSAGGSSGARRSRRCASPPTAAWSPPARSRRR